MYFSIFLDSVHAQDEQYSFIKDTLIDLIDTDLFFKDEDYSYTTSVYLSDPYFKHYFEKDTLMLIDQLKRIGEVQFDQEEKKHYIIWGRRLNEYLNDSFPLEDQSASPPHFTSNGFSFYDKNSSSFGCECPPGSFDNKRSIGYLGNPNCVILDENNNQVFKDLTIRKIARTPISYVFILENDQNQQALFNTNKKEIISDWVNHISYPTIEDYYFSPLSLTNYLLKIHNITVGFKTLKKIDNREVYKVINSNGDIIIDSKEFLNPFDDSSLSYNTCQFLSSLGSNFFKYTKNSLYGITTAKYDRIILNAAYYRISDLDYKGNVILRKKNTTVGSDLFSIYNLFTKKYFSDPDGFLGVEKYYFPKFSGESKHIADYNNPYLPGQTNYSSDYCANNSSFKSSNIPNKVVYIAEKKNNHQIYDVNGKLLLSDSNKIELLEAYFNVMVVKLKTKTILLNYSGKVLFEVPTPSRLEILSDRFAVFVKFDEKNNKKMGVFDFINGQIFPNEFENIFIENKLIYGLTLGTKTLIFGD